MNAFLPSVIAVICSVSLLLRVHRLDPFSSYSMRAFMFPGFRRQRRIAWLAGSAAKLTLLSLSLLSDLIGHPLGQAVMIAVSIYFLLGAVKVLLKVRDLGFDRRDADPMLQALALLVTWPVWRKPSEAP